MGQTTAPAARPASTRLGPYGRVLRQPVLRRILPGMLVSALGDGMSLVAVAWLAVQIAPPGQRGAWTGLAVAAYSLPATVGAAVLGRLVRGLRGVRLVAVDASLRAVVLGTVAVLAVAGVLSPVGYVALLAVSSLMHAWGNAGTYTVIAEQLPDGGDRVAGNALVSTFTQAAIVVGPALAGGLTAVLGPGWVIGADAASFAVLAACCAFTSGASSRPAPAGAGALPAGQAEPAVRAEPAVEPVVEAAVEERPAVEEGSAAGAEPAETSGWRVILGHPQLLGLTAVTCVFFFLYGPVEVALPIHVADDLHGSPSLLGAFWAVFGVGAVLGGLGAGLVRNRPLWIVVVGIIIGWGAALLPVGLIHAAVPGIVGFGVGGLIYGPFLAICTALFQRTSPPRVLSRVLATRAALTGPSAALGTLLGGPAVGAIGGRQTLLASALSTIALGVVVAAAIAASRARAARPPSGRLRPEPADASGRPGAEPAEPTDPSGRPRPEPADPSGQPRAESALAEPAGSAGGGHHPADQIR